MIEFPCLLLLILVFIQWTLKCYQILYFVYVYCLSTVLFSLPSSSVHHNAFMIFHKIKASFMIDPFISRVVGPSQYFMIFHKRKGFIHDRSIYQSCRVASIQCFQTTTFTMYLQTPMLLFWFIADWRKVRHKRSSSSWVDHGIVCAYNPGNDCCCCCCCVVENPALPM